MNCQGFESFSPELSDCEVDRILLFSLGTLNIDLKQKTRRSKHCGFSIYIIFDNSKSKSIVRLVRAEKMVWSGLVFARKIARMIFDSEYTGFNGSPED